jgi:hypothetical protein
MLPSNEANICILGTEGRYFNVPKMAHRITTVLEKAHSNVINPYPTNVEYRMTS